MTGQHEASIRHLGAGYEPHVDEVAGRLLYSLPVDSGFVSAAFSFGIRPADLAVLLSDPYRRAVLESVAHTTLQSSMLAGSKPVTAPDFAAIVASVLHAPPEALQSFIADVDRQHNVSTDCYATQAMTRKLRTD